MDKSMGVQRWAAFWIGLDGNPRFFGRVYADLGKAVARLKADKAREVCGVMCVISGRCVEYNKIKDIDKMSDITNKMRYTYELPRIKHKDLSIKKTI